MAKKYYAVKQGKKTGIFTTWNECRQNVHGYPGAEYKSFTNKADAESYLHGVQEGDEIVKDQTDEVDSEVVAYVDGSFNKESNEFSYGAVIFYESEQLHFNEKINDPELVSMRNVAGEIKGSEKAMAFAIEQGAKTLAIHHDYEGVAKWCTGEWKANKPGTIGYKKFYDEIKKDVKIRFVKVKSHSGDEFNDLADRLAKEAFAKTEYESDTVAKTSEKTKKLGIYVDPTELENLIVSAGTELWDDFVFKTLEDKGAVIKCDFIANDKPCSLNFYNKKNGTTTMSPTGKNTEISSLLEDRIIEKCEYTDIGISKSHSFVITKEWAYKLVDFLERLKGIKKDRIAHDNPQYTQCKFESVKGDRLNINIYETGKVVLQGKPAYLYTEALAFLSYCPQVSIADILEANNTFHEVDIKVDETRIELQNLMPNAYEDFDETLFKLLSPSITLKKVSLELEDYSCYAFPALRALEGYLMQVFSIEGIIIGHRYGEQSGSHFRYVSQSDSYLLKRKTADILSNPKSRVVLEEVYNYLNKNRHTLFHSEQILFNSVILEDKLEADQIVNEVIDMIERTYTYLTA